MNISIKHNKHKWECCVLITGHKPLATVIFEGRGLEVNIRVFILFFLRGAEHKHIFQNVPQYLLRLQNLAKTCASRDTRSFLKLSVTTLRGRDNRAPHPRLPQDRKNYQPNNQNSSEFYNFDTGTFFKICFEVWGSWVGHYSTRC